MKIMRPKQDGILPIASNITETLPVYSSVTTYGLGAQVIDNISKYESLQAGNLNHSPSTSPTWWLRVGPSNWHAMFDDQVSTSSIMNIPMDLIFQTGPIDTFYLGNVQAESATVIVRDGLGGPIIYEKTLVLNGEESLDWYQYFFYDPLIKRTQALFTGIPPYSNSHVYLTVENGPNPVSVGIVSYGNLITVGKTQYGASVGIIDYSKKETDEFGNTIFVKRAFSKRMNCQVFVNNTQLNRTQRLLYDIRAVPVLWIASEDPSLEEPLVVFGFYRDFSTEISYPTASLCNIEVEGLI